MNRGAIQRITRQFAYIAKSSHSGFSISPIDSSNIQQWIGCLEGPTNSQYDGLLFKFLVIMKNDYPFTCPQFKFITKIMHPNINFEDGVVIYDFSRDFSPALTIYKMVCYLRTILSNPNYGNMKEEEIEEFKVKIKEFHKK